MTNGHTLEEKFNTAVEIVQNLPKDGPVPTSNDEKLQDAWNTHGNMGKEQAMEKYLEVLLDKITEVEKKHDIKQWLVGELFEFMAPKFAVIGKYYGNEEEKQKGSEDGPLSPVENTATGSVSDTEYDDAVDIGGHSRSSSYDLQESPSSKKYPDLSTYCERVETELKIISEQIERLSNAVEQRHSSLLNVFRRATVYLFIPKGVSWMTIIFFIVWPFMAHLLMKYLKRLPFQRKILL